MFLKINEKFFSYLCRKRIKVVNNSCVLLSGAIALAFLFYKDDLDQWLTNVHVWVRKWCVFLILLEYLT